MTGNQRKLRDRIVWKGIKLPLIVIGIAVGFVFEFLVSYPFMLMCAVDNTVRRRAVAADDGNELAYVRTRINDSR